MNSPEKKIFIFLFWDISKQKGSCLEVLSEVSCAIISCISLFVHCLGKKKCEPLCSVSEALIRPSGCCVSNPLYSLFNTWHNLVSYRHVWQRSKTIPSCLADYAFSFEFWWRKKGVSIVFLSRPLPLKYVMFVWQNRKIKRWKWVWIELWFYL